MPEETVSPKIRARNEILRRYQIKTSQDSDDIYIFKKGFWDSYKSDKFIDSKVQRILDYKYSIHNSKEVLASIRAITRQELKPTDDFIGLKNCDLQLNHRVELGHSPTRFITNQLPVNYNPSISYDSWNEYLYDLVDEEMYVLSLQEFVGYCLTNHDTAKKLLYLFGKKDSGKTTFAKILMHFFGKRNYSKLSLLQICDKDFLGHLLNNKLVNICSDIDYYMTPKRIGTIVTLTGGDDMRFDKKFKPDGVTLERRPKMIFCANGAPTLPNYSLDDAFFDRFLPIPFTNSFQTNSEFIKTYLTDENKSAILNWALDGLKRLKTNEWHFSYDPTDEVIRDWFREGMVPNDVERFLIDICLPRVDGYVSKTVLWNVYEKWCFRSGTTQRVGVDFGRKVSNHRFWNVRRHRPVIDGEQVECWAGFILDDNKVALLLGT